MKTRTLSDKTFKVLASMAIEEMYFDTKFLKEIEKIDNGEKTLDELREEVLRKYARC